MTVRGRTCACSPRRPGAVAPCCSRSRTDVDNLLARLRLILAAIVIGGIALAALLGMFVAGAALAPIRRLRARAST